MLSVYIYYTINYIIVYHIIYIYIIKIDSDKLYYAFTCKETKENLSKIYVTIKHRLSIKTDKEVSHFPYPMLW